MEKKTVSLAFVFTLLALLMLVSFVRAMDPLQVIDTITLDKEAKCVAVNEETNQVYVGVENGLLIIDGETGTIVTEILPDTDIRGIAVNPQTNRIYAFDYGENIVVIDGTTNQQVGEIPERAYDSKDFAINPVTNLIYIQDGSAFRGEYDCLAVYSGENNTVVTRVNMPGSNVHPYYEHTGVTVNPETNRIYATWTGDNSLHVIDGNTNSIINTVYLSRFSQRVSVNSCTNYIYIGGAVLDGETFEEVDCEYPGSLEVVDPVNNLLYTTHYDTLYVLDGTTHGVLSSLEIEWMHSVYSDNVAVNCKTGRGYVLINHEQQIVVIPEFPIWTTILSALFTLAVVTFIFRRRLFKAKIHQQSSAL